MKKLKYFEIIENSTSLFLVKLVDLLLTIWLIPYLIFKVGINNYGLYAFSVSIVFILVNILNYGFDLTAVRDIAKNRKNTKVLTKTFNEILSVKFFLFIVLGLLFLACIFLIPALYKDKLLYIYSILILFSHVFSLRWFFLGIEKMKFLFIIRINKTFIYVALVYFFIQLEKDYVLIPLLEGAAMFVVYIATFIVVINKFKIKLEFLKLKEIKDYLIEHFNSFVNLLIPLMFNNTLVFFTGILGLPSQVGMVHIGVKFVNAFSTVNAILTKIFFSISNRTQNNKKLFTYLIIIGVLLSILMFFGSEYILLKWLEGKSLNYISEIIQLVKVLSPIPFFVALISSYGINGLLVLFKDKVFSRITILSFIFLILFALALIPKIGVLGAGLSLLFSRLIYAITSFIYYKKHV